MSLENDLSIGLSAAALVVSGLLAVRQNAIQSRTNSVPGIMDLLDQFRDPATLEIFDRVTSELPKITPDKGGLSSLPPSLRYDVVNLCNLFQQIGSMIVLRIVDERPFLVLFRWRVVKVWNVVEPFVTESRKNPEIGPDFMGVLEIFADRAKRLPKTAGPKILRTWRKRRL